MADTATQQPQQVPHLIGPATTETWTKAADVSAADWRPAVHGGMNTYIRHRRLGVAKTYPAPRDDAAPAARAGGLHPRLRWDERIGEYIEIEPSVSVAGGWIVQAPNGTLQSLSPAFALAPLTADEQLQLDTGRLKAALEARVTAAMSGPVAAAAWAAQLTTPANIDILAFNDDDGSKALRWSRGSGLTGNSYVHWYNWLPGPVARIQAGAGFVFNQLEHWRQSLGAGVTISRIRLTGSDLHEDGLGAMFVTFDDPVAGTSTEYVVKSEDKALERELFGTQNDSLANRINRMAGLNPAEALATFRMETAANFGSLIEKVQGVQADTFANPQVMTNATREALVFAFITGLSDLHSENVLWDNGKPYFIDADNALNHERLNLTPFIPEARHQSGLAGFNRDEVVAFEQAIENNPDQIDNSKIMTALLENRDTHLEPIVDAVRTAFTGKSGRVVPVPTLGWGQLMQDVFIQLPVGLPADTATTTRWGVADRSTAYLENGNNPFKRGPGLLGETGEGTPKLYDTAAEKTEVMADMSQGQIPFYVYHYDSGHVTHNGQKIWHGKPLADALEAIFDKFPEQKNTWDT